jgi:mono/diheme cytochrome c family protein
MMRRFVVLLCLIAAGCQRSGQPAFDGAQQAAGPAFVAHGERLAHVLGCAGCHGPRFEGGPIEQGQPLDGRLYASNLTLAVPQDSDAVLDEIIRRGVHPRRTNLWAMPSQIFQRLSDPDFKALLAYLRTLRPTGKPVPEPQLDAIDRRRIAAGEERPAAALLAEYNAMQPVDLGPQFAFGRYIASVTCAGCHGSALGGDPARKAPDLVVASGYSRAEYEALMTKGVATGNRKLDPMMFYAARGRFSHLTPHERGALYDYLVERARR